MSDDPMSIWDLKQGPWIDAPRYYPPGQHPATAMMRAQLAKAEQIKADAERKSVEHGVRYETQPLEEFIAYLKDELAMFESRESELKARDDQMLRDRRDD